MNKSILRNLEQNIKSKFSYIPRSITSMDISSSSGLMVIDSQLNSDMFNIIFCESNVSDNIIESTIRDLKRKTLPAAFWVGFQDEPQNLKSHLEQLGFVSEEAELAMCLDLDSYSNKAEEDKHGDINIEHVKNQKQLSDFMSVLTTLIPHERAAIESYFNIGSHLILHPQSRLKLFVGYIEEEPVSTSSLFLAEQVAGIFDIITLPQARGKGIGTLMTNAALSQAKSLGYQYATLTATDDAKILYEKIGFRSLAEMCVFQILPE